MMNFTLGHLRSYGDEIISILSHSNPTNKDLIISRHLTLRTMPRTTRRSSLLHSCLSCWLFNVPFHPILFC